MICFRSVLARAVATLALTVIGTASLSGHTKLQKSEPAADSTVTAPPPHVQLWFNEAPDLKVSQIEVTGPAGKLELGPAHLMDAKSVMATIKGEVPDGKYTATWRTAGKDGHVIKGEFTFTVKRSQ